MKKEDRIWSWTIAFLVLVVVFLLLGSGAPAAEASEKGFKLDLGYFPGSVTEAFTYQAQSWRETSGTVLNADGFFFKAVVPVKGAFGVGGSWEINHPLSQPVQFRKSSNSSFPDQTVKQAGSSYFEIFGSAELPKTGGHQLLAGIAYWRFGQELEVRYLVPSLPGVDGDGQWTEKVDQFGRDLSAVGLVIGLAGERKIGKLALSYSGRGYPRLARTDQRLGDGWGYKSSSTMSGFALEGAAIWSLTNHVGISGGYKYRRLSRPDPYQSPGWSVDSTIVDKGPTIGLRLTF